MPIKHLILALIVSLVWGVNFVVMKIGLLQLDPFLFISLRFIIVLIMLLPWLRLVKGHMLQVFWVGVCLGGLHFGSAILGLGLAENVTSIIIVVQLHVPMTLIMAHFLLNEKVSYWRGLGILVSFSGVLFLSFDPAIVDERIAIVVILAATIFYSVGSILMRRLKDVGVFTTQAWIAFYALPILVPLTLSFEQDHITQIIEMDYIGWSMLLYTAVLSSLVGYGGLNYLFKHHPVTAIAPILLTVPLFATIAAVVFLGETISLRFIIGASITLGGLGLIHFRDWWKKRKMSRELLP